MFDFSTTTADDNQVCVVLCSYQGARYIAQQIESIVQQSYPCRLLISDDGSSDNTEEVVRSCLRLGVDQFNASNTNVGFVKNFEQAISQALAEGAQYIALSDQDDIWEEDRVAAGVKRIQQLEKQHGRTSPLLVHSDLALIDHKGDPFHPSFIALRRYRVSNERRLSVALGENGVMGNTVLMNRRLAELSLPFPQELHVHDYWISLMAELFGHRGLLEVPYVKYRLHAHNTSNTATSVHRGGLYRLIETNWATLFKRNFKLPFKEDSRAEVLQYLLKHQDRFPPMSESQIEQIEHFLDYLNFTQPRLHSLRYIITSDTIRPGFLHRCRLAFAVFLTNRYSRVID